MLCFDDLIFKPYQFSADKMDTMAFSWNSQHKQSENEAVDSTWLPDGSGQWPHKVSEK